MQLGRNGLAQVDAEEALLHAAHANALRRAVAQELRERSDAVRIEALVTRLLCEHFGASRALYAEVVEDGHAVVIRADHCVGVASVVGRHALADFGLSVRSTLESGLTLVADHCDRLADLTAEQRARYRGLGVAAHVTVPLVRAGRLTALLSIHQATPRAWRPDEVALIEEMAERTWASMERARAELGRRLNAERLRFMLDVAGMGSWEVDLAAGVESRDAPFNRLLGGPARPSTEALAERFERVLPPDRAHAGAAWEAALRSAGAYTAEFRIRGGDGAVRWVSEIGRAVPDDHGRTVAVTGMSLDITDRRRAEDALRASEETYRGLFESIDEGFCIIEKLEAPRGEPADFRYLEANRAFEAQSGLVGVLGRTIRAVVPVEADWWCATYDRIAVTGEPVRFERLLRSRGKMLELYAFRVGGEDSRRVAVIFKDITERKEHEEQLRRLNDTLEARVAERTSALEWHARHLLEHQNLLQATLNSTTDGIIVVDRSDGVLIENPAALRHLGGSVKGSGRRWVDVAGLRDAEGEAIAAGRSPTERALRGEEVREQVLSLPGKGAVFELNAAPLADGEGRVVGAIANLRDVTGRKREEAIQARLACLVRSTRAAVITWDVDLHIMDWNDGAARLFGHAAEEVQGRHLSMLCEPHAFEAFQRIAGGRGGDVGDGEAVMRHRDGHPVHVAWTIATVRDGRGRVIGASAVGTDVSERLRIERDFALLVEDRRQALGRDLHDTLGQQLTAIGLMATSIKDRIAATEAAVFEKLEQAVDTAKDQLRSIIKGFAPADVDARGLQAALDELVDHTQRLHGVACRLECAEPVAPIDSFTANHLYMVAREAVHNAVKHAGATRVVVRLKRRGGLALAVEDDGIGIARDRVAGMGLRIMEYRCKIIGGVLAIGPGARSGTCVTCTLPSKAAAPHGARGAVD